MSDLKNRLEKRRQGVIKEASGFIIPDIAGMIAEYAAPIYEEEYELDLCWVVIDWLWCNRRLMDFSLANKITGLPHHIRPTMNGRIAHYVDGLIQIGLDTYKMLRSNSSIFESIPAKTLIGFLTQEGICFTCSEHRLIVDFEEALRCIEKRDADVNKCYKEHLDFLKEHGTALVKFY
jgi:hypothetical protein